MSAGFLENYYFKIKELIATDKDHYRKIYSLKKILLKAKSKKKKIIIFGNGGSSAIASHFSVDLTKNAKIKCVNFNEYDLITCFANDFGYENWMKKAIEYYADKDDVCIFISSSGKSKNILNACKYIKRKELSKIVTFSGFDINNPLKKQGILNFWVNSKVYNHVENIHQIWLLSLIDLLIFDNNK